MATPVSQPEQIDDIQRLANGRSAHQQGRSEGGNRNVVLAALIAVGWNSSATNTKSGNKRINAMTNTTTGLEQTEQEILTFELSDETLEAAAGTMQEKAVNYTLGACTGLSVCPGW
jgi:hypothetical protein